MHTVPVGFAVFPLPNVRVVVSALPDTITFLDTVEPLAIVNFPVDPGVNSLPMGLPVTKFALIAIAIKKELEAPAISLVLDPVSFVKPARAIHDDAFTVSLPTVKFSSVDRVAVLLNAKSWQ